MPDALRGKIKALAVETPQGSSGVLLRESQFVFNYDTQNRGCEIALGMPLRAASYTSNQPHPIFAMNLPEGNLRHKIKERYGKQFAKLDDMAMLSIVGYDQIGRLTLNDTNVQVSRPQRHIGLTELLKAQASDDLFDYLLDNYLTSGISGVQPKVLIPDADIGLVAAAHTTARLSDLIVKASSSAHPNLTQNEFLCMDAAKRAGIDVPEFHLSDDGSLFVLRRFDRNDSGERLGFEDMSVLAGQTYDDYGHYKYGGSYEAIVAIIEAYCGSNAAKSKQQFFEYFAASCMMRNGDAHMKNFGLLYESPNSHDGPKLSPMYDVVTTSVYDLVSERTGRVTQDRELALKLNKSKEYPNRRELIAFGHRCNVLKPERVLERIDAGMTASLEANRDRVPEQLIVRMKDEWDMSRLRLNSDAKRVRIASLGNQQDYKKAITEPISPLALSAEQERIKNSAQSIQNMLEISDFCAQSAPNEEEDTPSEDHGMGF
jgi:serine/threonine-protein kinase HipA